VSTLPAARAPTLPLAIRAANRAARWVRAVGFEPVSFDEERLIRDAVGAAGADDFGPEPFLAPMRRVIDSLEREANLTWLGRTIARNELVRVLRNRLGLLATRRAHPEIARVEVHQPIVVVGLPRTGSTILHDILARDPAHRAPLTWECNDPCPPPEASTFDSDSRIASNDEQLAGVDRLIPGFKSMHPMGARLAQECVVLMQQTMCSVLFHNEYRVPSYQDWLDDPAFEWGPVYEFHRHQLQHLQWRCPRERWVLKTGAHMWSLDALLETYPNACVVQTHRDPVKVATSYASLTTLVRAMSSDAVDPSEIAADWTPRLARALERAIDVRDSRRFPGERFYDVHFRSFLADPMKVIEGIYGHFGIELTGEAADRMRRFIDENPQGKHGVHRYAPEEYGLDAATERKRFARYADRFGIESEPEGPIAGRVRDL
jgi:sulfotransferase family protein